jgi:calcium/calmodulin-dependent protein kinase I
MVYDELEVLQKMNHPHIVHFVDWFESKVRFLTIYPSTTWSNHTIG